VRLARAVTLAGALGVAAAISPAHVVHAFDDLNAAQTLVYDRPHLAGTRAGDEIVYRYAASVGGATAVDDRATLAVDAESDAERRDVTLDFLHDERRLELPPFERYRGNPVLIAMLEHVAQSLAASAGGGALYVRNRIRDGFAREDTRIEEGRVLHDGTEISTVALSFEPFSDDAFLGRRPGYRDATIRIVLSDDVPGGVLAIGARSGASAADASGRESGGLPFDYELRLDDNPDENR